MPPAPRRTPPRPSRASSASAAASRPAAGGGCVGSRVRAHPSPPQSSGPTSGDLGARRAAPPSPPRRGCRRSPQPPGLMSLPSPAVFPPSPAKAAFFKRDGTSRAGDGRFPSPREPGGERRGGGNRPGEGSAGLPRLGARLRLPEQPQPPVLLLWLAGGCGGAGRGRCSAQPPAQRLLTRGGRGGGCWKMGWFNLLFPFFPPLLAFSGAED